MDAIESAKTYVEICAKHKRLGIGCKCCILEDHCHTTFQQLVNGKFEMKVDEEHFNRIEKWRKQNEPQN